jgi:hypothetical protein
MCHYLFLTGLLLIASWSAQVDGLEADFVVPETSISEIQESFSSLLPESLEPDKETNKIISQPKQQEQETITLLATVDDLLARCNTLRRGPCQKDPVCSWKHQDRTCNVKPLQAGNAPSAVLSVLPTSSVLAQHGEEPQVLSERRQKAAENRKRVEERRKEAEKRAAERQEKRRRKSEASARGPEAISSEPVLEPDQMKCPTQEQMKILTSDPFDQIDSLPFPILPASPPLLPIPLPAFGNTLALPARLNCFPAA